MEEIVIRIKHIARAVPMSMDKKLPLMRSGENYSSAKFGSALSENIIFFFQKNSKSTLFQMNSKSRLKKFYKIKKFLEITEKRAFLFFSRIELRNRELLRAWRLIFSLFIFDPCHGDQRLLSIIRAVKNYENWCQIYTKLMLSL